MRVPVFIDRSFPPIAETAVETPFTGVFGRLIGSVRRAVAEQRLARELAELDDRTLADIGITRSALSHGVRTRDYA